MGLPDQADLENVTAWLVDGLLTVTLPKAESDKSRRIQIIVG